MPRTFEKSKKSKTFPQSSLNNDVKTICYIIGIRGCDEYRVRNLLLVIEWLAKLQTTLDKVSLTICIVEQDGSERIKPLLHLTKVEYIFIQNDGWYNRGLSFNIASKKFINHDYFFFADNDIILTEKDSLKLFSECFEYDAINPYKQVIDTKKTVSSENVIEFYKDGFKGQDFFTTKREGTCFTGGICGVSRETFLFTKGWDERFMGRGYEDYAFTSKLRLFITNIYTTEYTAMHIWHPWEVNTTREINERLDKEYEGYHFEDYANM